MSAANLIGEEGRAMTKSDVVKRGLLKFKASKVKGTAGESARGPKSCKPIFMVFRSLHSGDKFLHLYTNEKKFHEAEKPKWEVLLKDASSVYFLSDRKSFCLSMTDGGLLFMDCSTVEETEEWVRCLNAVLFAKSLQGDGVLRYVVDMLPNGSFSHEGPSVLELSHCELIVWDRQVAREIVRWKLNHLRSFKAKNRTLTIVTGSRSCTGHKEFEFQSRHSVQITHTIETIVARVKFRSSPTMGTRTSQDNSSTTTTTTSRTRPLPSEPSLPSNVPNILDPLPFHDETFVSSSFLATIPNFTTAEVYENAESSDVRTSYGRLDYFTLGSQTTDTSELGMASGAANSSMPQRISPPRSLPLVENSDAQYDVIDMPKAQGSRLTTPTARPTVTRNSVYETIDSPGMQEIDRMDAAAPPVPLPRELARSPVISKQAGFRQDSAVKLPMPQAVIDTYEKLEHASLTGPVGAAAADNEAQVHPEMYSSLHHMQPTNSAPPMEDDEYGELDYDRKGAWVGGPGGAGQFKRMISAPVALGATKEISSSYSLVNGDDSSMVMVEGYEILQGERKPRLSPIQRHRSQKNRPGDRESYGRLTHGGSDAGGAPERVVDRNKPFPNPRPSRLLSPEGGGGSPPKGFNPYGTMPSEKRLSTNSTTSSIGSSAMGDYDEIIEEESSTPIYSVASKGKQRAARSRESCSTMEGSPPPGYETLGAYSKGTEASTKSSASPGSSPALTPDRSLPMVPPRRTASSKRRYENVGPNGEILVKESPDPDDDAVPLENEAEEVGPKPPIPAREGKPPVKARTASVIPAGNDSVTTTNMPKVQNTLTSAEEAKPQRAPKPKVKPRPKYSETASKS